MSLYSSSSLISFGSSIPMKLNYLDISTTICDVRIDVNNVSYRVLLWTGYFIYFRPSMHHALACDCTTPWATCCKQIQWKKSWENIFFQYCFIFYIAKSLLCNWTWILSKQISYHKIDNLNLLFLYDHLCSLNKILLSVLPLADLCIEYILPIIEKIVVPHRIRG